MKRILLLSGFAFFFMQAHAQFGFDYGYDLDLMGKGARAAGMAYAFNAVADDATALSWNPSGIVQIRKPELAFSNSIKNTEYRHALYEYDYKPVYSLDFIGFVYPIKLKKKNLVFGVSYQNRMNFKFNYENQPGEFGIKYGKNQLTVNSVSLSGAYSINRYAGIGISFNKWFSLGNKSETTDIYYLRVMHKEEPGNYPDTAAYVVTEKFRYSACNFTIGILLDFSSFHIPLRYTLKYDSKMGLKDDYIYNSRMDYTYYNGPDTAWSKSAQGIINFEYPGILTNGFAYKIGDYFTVACDFDLQLFNDNVRTWDYSRVYGINIRDKDSVLSDEAVRDSSIFFYSRTVFNQYRIGLEYVFRPEFGLIPVRAGWKSNPDELHTYNEDLIAEKRVMARSINVGTGITMKRFSIDLAYEARWFHRMDEQYMNEKKTDHFFVMSVIWYIK